MATITVTSLGDTIANDGVVTLREAIEAANTDAASGDVPAGSGTDSIVFASGLSGSIVLTDTLHISTAGPTRCRCRAPTRICSSFTMATSI